MKPAGRMILVGALTGAICAAAAGSASAKIYSSGDVDKRIPDLGRAVSTIRIKKDAVISDINVNIRVSHTADQDLLIGLLGPGHQFQELVSQGDASGVNFGTGPKSCGGTFTNFDDESGGTITGGTAPYAASFEPAEGLNGMFQGLSTAFRWKLYVFDLDQDDKGTLHCWQLDVDT